MTRFLAAVDGASSTPLVVVGSVAFGRGFTEGVMTEIFGFKVNIFQDLLVSRDGTVR